MKSSKLHVVYYIAAYILFYPIIVKAQEKPFNFQLNSGYTYFLGNKYTYHTSNLGLGSYSSGLVAAEVELQYKVINKSFANARYLNRMEKWSNPFSDNLYIEFAYGYNFGMPFTYIIRTNHIDDEYVFNMSTHSARLGLIYDLTEYLERLFYSNFRGCFIYMGVDGIFLLSNLTKNYFKSFDGQITEGGNIPLNNMMHAGVMPKLRIEYYLTGRSFRGDAFSMFWRRHSLYLAISAEYAILFPLNYQTNNVIQTTQKFTQSVNGRIGIGIKF